MNAFAQRRSTRTVPTRVIGGSPVYRCHYCPFSDPDPEVAFQHLAVHSTGASDAGSFPPNARDVTGLPPVRVPSSGAPVAAQPVVSSPPGDWRISGWLRRHFGWLVF